MSILGERFDKVFDQAVNVVTSVSSVIVTTAGAVDDVAQAAKVQTELLKDISVLDADKKRLKYKQELADFKKLIKDQNKPKFTPIEDSEQEQGN